MFKKAEMEPLAKRNLRYRILKTEDNYYLLDVERPFLIVYFLPLLIYFVPHRCYEMSKEEYEQLSQSEEQNARLKEAFEKHGLGYGLGTGVGAMLLSRVFDINQFLKFDSSRISNFLAILIVLLVFGLRLWLTLAYQVPSGLKNRGYHKIYLYPRFVKELIFSILLYIMSVLFTIVLISGFLTNQVDNYIVHIGLLIFLTFWLLIGNMFFMRPASNYWIKIKEKKRRKNFMDMISRVSIANADVKKAIKERSEAIYDIVIAHQVNDYFERIIDESKFSQLEILYFKALNCLLKGNDTKAKELFNTIIKEDNELYIVRESKKYLGDERYVD